MLFVFEGIDGCGKTSLSKLVMDELINKGYDVAWFKNPTDMKWGKQIRKAVEDGNTLTPEQKAQLFMSDRYDNVEKQIKPAINAGKIVLQDRYYFSTAAYQGAEGLDWAEVVENNEKFCVMPSVVFFILTHPELALSRIEKEGRKKTSYEKLDLLTRIDEVYRRMFIHLKNEAPYKIVYLKGSKSLEVLQKKVVKKIVKISNFL